MKIIFSLDERPGQVVYIYTFFEYIHVSQVFYISLFFLYYFMDLEIQYIV